MTDTIERIWTSREDIEAAHSWNVLVQVLLPMVLFVIAVAIALAAQIDDLRQSQSEIIGSDHALSKLYDTKIHLQLQTLLLALEKVTRSEEEALRLSAFPDSSPDRIALDGWKVEDPDFRHLCNETFEKFKDPPSYHADLYRRVLSEAGLIDPVNMDIERRDLLMGSRDLSTEALDIENGRIIDWHRRRVHNAVLTFAESIRERTTRLQSNLAQRMLNVATEEEHNIDIPGVDIPRLVELIAATNDEAKLKIFGESLVKSVFAALDKQLEKDELRFLERPGSGT